QQNITYPNLEAPTGSSTNSYSTTQGFGNQWTWTNTVNYKHNFNGKHNLSVLGGSEAIRSSSRNLSGARNGFFILGDQNYYYLKFRVGYGETGNQNIPANNAVDVYQSLITNSYYPITGSNTLAAGARQNQIGNPQLKWESVKATNLGIDFDIFNGMFDGAVDVY